MLEHNNNIETSHFSMISSFFALLGDHGTVLLIGGLAGAVLAMGAQRGALYLMFHPKEFRGWKSPHLDALGLPSIGMQGLGWQGIVPQQASNMAEVSVRIMTHRLLPLVEIMKRVSPEALARSIQPGMEDTAEEVTREALRLYKPKLWETLPSYVQGRIIQRARAEVFDVAVEIVRDICKYPDKFLDLKALVIQVLNQKPELLIDLFQRAGKDPMRFLLLFAGPAGFITGVLTALVWVSSHGNLWWVLATGIALGAVSKWLALQSLFFHPQQKTGRLGGYVGYFFRAQAHIAHTYAEVVAEQIVTPAHIVHGLTLGPNAHRLIGLMHHHIQRALDERSSSVKPLLIMFLGASEWQKIRHHVAQSFVDRLQSHMRASEEYLSQTLEIRTIVEDKLATLNAADFERILRPVFQGHEWLLTVVGGAWGLLLGAGLWLVMH